MNKFDPASEKRLIEIADLLWQIQKTYSRTDRNTPLTREEIEAMKLASSDIHGILHPTPGLGRFNDPPNDKIANAWEQDDDSQDWRRYKAGYQDEDESLALVARPRAEAMPDGSINTPSVLNFIWHAYAANRSGVADTEQEAMKAVDDALKAAGWCLSNRASETGFYFRR